MIVKRTQKLAALLRIEDMPKEFRAPSCLGYFHDTGDDMARYGLVYRIPSPSSGAEPLSLLGLVQQGAKPSLTQRILLAHVISSSLMYLHSVKWLHKVLRKENIVFFVPEGQTPDYSTPIVSGFEYARPDLPEELTEIPEENFEHDMYRHSDALGRSDTRSRKSWDIYSLGVVLVEVAFWKPIGDILDLQPTRNNSRSRLRKVRDMLLSDGFLHGVGVVGGEKYQDVVWRCIKGGSTLGIHEEEDEAIPEVGASMQRVFSQLVVGKLQEIQV
jgi:hypothetical protein